MTDRNGLVRLFPKGVAWAEVGAYKVDFSQIVFDSCAPSE
jgi:hypothetical protein